MGIYADQEEKSKKRGNMGKGGEQSPEGGRRQKKPGGGENVMLGERSEPSKKGIGKLLIP